MSGNGKRMNLTLHVWRQKNDKDKGRFVTYQAKSVSPDMSFLEMLDVVNEQLTQKGEEPIAFDHDCREGICGTCGLVINGKAARAATAHHGLPAPHAHVQGRRHDRHRALARQGLPGHQGPDRGPRARFDRIIQAGGFVSVNDRQRSRRQRDPGPEADAELAMDAAACIGCGACVAACPNASAMLFTAAKIAHLALLPQGQPER